MVKTSKKIYKRLLGCGSVRILGSGGACEVRCARAVVGSGKHKAIERIVWKLVLVSLENSFEKKF